MDNKTRKLIVGYLDQIHEHVDDAVFSLNEAIRRVREVAKEDASISRESLLRIINKISIVRSEAEHDVVEAINDCRKEIS